MIEAASRPWAVPRDWAGQTCAVLGAGPSLDAATTARLRGRCRVIAVNTTGIDVVDSDTRAVIPARAPWADVLFAGDRKWWTEYGERARGFAGLRVSVLNGLRDPDVLKLALSPRAPYDPRPTHVVSGGNSGYQAVHVAAHYGATRILLFGFDMREVNKRRHYFGNHPASCNSRGRFDRWCKALIALQRALALRGVAVVNCTPGSALSIPRSTLDVEFPLPAPVPYEMTAADGTLIVGTTADRPVVLGAAHA